MRPRPAGGGAKQAAPQVSSKPTAEGEGVDTRPLPTAGARRFELLSKPPCLAERGAVLARMQGNPLPPVHLRSILGGDIASEGADVSETDPQGKKAAARKDDDSVAARTTALLSRIDRDAPVVGGLRPVQADAPRLGRYPVTGRLGVGGMGEVLSVRDSDLQRDVAAKVVRGRVDDRQLWKFVLEARITGRLAHPSIMPVYELGCTAEGQPYFTMKRIEGRTLGAVLAHAGGGPAGSAASRRAPPPASADAVAAAYGARLIEHLGILLKVCDAVAFAHSAGVIHRDLKPDNVMVGTFGEVLVCDWGLAKVRARGAGHDPVGDALLPKQGDGGAVVTLDGEVIGTPAYMPPEQAEGLLDQIDERSDIYALGAILYQMLCGHAPYEGKTSWVVLEQVRLRAPAPPSERSPAGGALIPWELEAVAAKAMARAREERYPSVVALRADLNAFLAGGLLAAARYTPSQRAWKWARRNARALAAAAVAMASLVGALGYTAVSAREQVRELEAQYAITREAELAAQRERDVAKVERDTAHAERRRAEESDAAAQAARDAAQASYRAAQIARDKAEASYAEACRMGAVHRLRALEREGQEDLWWTRLDRAKGTLQDLPSAERLDAATEAIDRWCAAAGALLAERAAYAGAATASRTESAAAPNDAWLAFRVGILDELCAGLDRLAALRARALERRQAYVAARLELVERAPAWALARAAIARHARYGGLELSPQVGLVPMGEDPTTGLWEFAVVGTGELPERAAGAPLPIADRTAIVLVLIPGGEYVVGAEPGGGRHEDPQATLPEGPEQPARLRPYFIARTELTQHQWQRMSGTNPSRATPGTRVGTAVITERHPVENLSWNTCTEVLARHGLVLPSEVQWEVAARGGSTSPWWTGADARALGRTDNLADACARRQISGISATEAWDDGHVIHAPVASYPDGRNPFGLHDVHGNVREWCRDAYDERSCTRRADDAGDRPGPAQAVPARSFRGGGWFFDARAARASYRFGTAADYRDDALGARPARPVAP